MSATQADVVAVVFLKAWEIYMRGDTAAFPPAVAERLVRAGIAAWAPGQGG